MCLIVFSWDNHPKYKLIMAANRDEFYARPTAKADYWKDHPSILGGRDLKALGTWMAISKSGRLATVTNFRDPANIREDASSRGDLPTGFLLSKDTPEKYVQSVHAQAEDYNGFNLILGTEKQMLHYSNYERKLNPVTPGIHGLSNAFLDTSWPKVDLAKQKLKELMAGEFAHEDLIEMMQDESIASDDILPETGVSKELESKLSAMCIRMEAYGTCCSTVITIDRDHQVQFTERSYPVGDRTGELVKYDFRIEP